MTRTSQRLLAADAIINLGLGAVLLLFPSGLVDIVGLPPTDTYFYPTILGGVIFGIGVALWVEYSQGSVRARGLGLGGAIAINFCGGGVLLGWLVLGDLRVPLRGQIVLWLLALLVLGIGFVELVTGSWRLGE